MRQILSTRYFSKLLELPQSWFDEELTGSITSKLTRSITNVTDFAKAFSNNFFTLLLTTFAVLIISAIYYWPLALLLAIVFPIYVWLTALTSRNWQTHQDVINHHIDTAGGRFQEVVSQIRVVKSYVTEASEQKQFNNHYDATVDATRQQSNHWHLMDTVRRVVLNVIFFGIYAIIFVRTAKGYFGVGDMILLIQLMTMARQPVQMMSYIIDVAQRAVAGAVRPGDVVVVGRDQALLGLLVGDRLEDRVEAEQRVAREVHLGDQPLGEGPSEQREVDMR